MSPLGTFSPELTSWLTSGRRAIFFPGGYKGKSMKLSTCSNLFTINRDSEEDYR